MLILGWHGHPQLRESNESTRFEYHDAAAVIIKDGQILAAIEEERLNRVKHSNSFPTRAIKFCLDQASATLHDVDLIATDSAEEFCDFTAMRDAVADTKKPFMNGRQVIADTFSDEFGLDVSQKLYFCGHHTAHLHSAWYPSGFSQALALCLDGDGDGAAGLVASCRDDQLRILRHIPEALSLGNFYLQQLFFLGYQRFDEYKAMGLAPYGDARVHEKLLQKMYRLEPEGRYEIIPQNDRILLMHESGLMSQARRKGQPFLQVHKDFAAALQVTLERIVDHVVSHFHKVSGSDRLCISGGVGHNCTLNGKLLRSGRFKEVYVQPAAHDAGNALGAALAAARESGQSIRRNLLPNVYLGSDIGSSDVIGSRLAEWMPLIQVELLSDAPKAAADLIASGSVIAWVQGKSEFGPRALGNRSIIADPRPAENKLIINSMIKKREEFRPFAPAVLSERLHEYFDIPTSTREVPFMVIVLPVRPKFRALLGAVTHVDGSARVQSVSQDGNPRFHALISAFEAQTGVPIVLNTSYNNDAEPIVDSIDDAVTTFLTTEIHALVIGDWLVRKSEPSPSIENLLNLVPTIPTTKKLVRHRLGETSSSHYVESTSSKYSSEQSIHISPEMFHILIDHRSDPARCRCDDLELDEIAREKVARELAMLWTRRAITMRPN